MSKQSITFDQVKECANALAKAGVTPTIANVAEHISQGRYKNRIATFLRQWRQEASSSQAGMLIIDNQGFLVDWNTEFINLIDLPEHIVEQRNGMAGIKYMLEQLEKPHDMFQFNGQPNADMWFKDGRVIERRSQPHIVDNNVEGRVWFFQDVTEQRQQHKKLALLERFITCSKNGLLLFSNDNVHSLVFHNAQIKTLLNISDDDLDDFSFVTFSKFIDDDHIRDLFLKSVENNMEFYDIVKFSINKDDFFWGELELINMHEQNNESHVGVMLQDVTERKALQDQLIHKATHDALTDLPNRVLFQDRLRQVLLLAERGRGMVSVVYLDLDGFKAINDTHGHDVGDNLLYAVAHRLRHCLRSSDVVARLAGDEFALILYPIKTSEDSIKIITKVVDELRKPFQIEELSLQISASVGVATYPRDGLFPESLLRKADTAMYYSKNSGGNQFTYYIKDINKEASYRNKMQSLLQGALDREEIHINYQPIFEVSTGIVSGVEALLRWKSPELGPISPLEFIPLAEESGLISSIGEWVLRTVCAQGLVWNLLGLPPLQIAVNIARRQLLQDDIVDIVQQCLDETGFDPKQLVLEFNESFIMSHSDEVVQKLDGFKRLGVKLTIDDFGMGHSSLRYLKHVSIDYLKIDKAFVRNIGLNKADEEMVTAIIAMAKSLRLKVVAEGAQSDRQMEFLRRYRCDLMQGFYFARPLDVAAVTKLLRENYGNYFKENSDGNIKNTNQSAGSS